MNPFLTRTLVVAVAALATAALAQQEPTSGGCCAPQQTKKSGPATVARQAKGVQKVTVTVADGAYSPATISVKAGKPVELTFVKGKDIGCGGTVVFPDLKISRELKASKTVVAFTPKKAGTLAFTCSMGMYQGSVIVK